MKLYLSLFLLFTGFITRSQDYAFIRGFISDTSGTPLEQISIAVKELPKINTTTDRKGRYRLLVPAQQKITIVFSGISVLPYQEELTLGKDAEKVLSPSLILREYELSGAVVSDQGKRQTASMVEVKQTDLAADIMGGDITATLAMQALGVSKTNELSSNYTVRGGNFDENLVYVNDFEVYRPYLVRSGQQEGLSFANPYMVQNIKFNSGGFQAKYGDKMSSVMDVTYKRPKKFGGSVYGSLLGLGGHLEGCDKQQKFTFLIGVRQRLSQYVLRSLQTQGQYSPNFLDVQGYFTFLLHPQWSLEVLSSYARNQYDFVPVNRETTFGTVTNVKKVTMYFEGQESDRYQSLMNGIALNYTPNDKLKLKWLGSYYRNEEKESFDILGEYFLSQVEANLGRDNFGEEVFALGVGGLQDWARNELKSQVGYAGHKGTWFYKKHQLQWGVDYKREIIQDKISEWDRLDSAGYSLPYSDDSNVEVFSVLKSRFSLHSNRYAAFIQNTWRFGDTAQYSLNFGLRFQYWDVNQEPIVTPRLQFSFRPLKKHDLIFNLAIGTYYQPPFYREMRDLQGRVNTSLKSQKSLQAVAGINYAFKAWKRNFNFTTEVYYKYLWDLVPYEFDNALIRYYGRNNARGYATGIDLRLNGELVPDAESWISLSIMQTAEDILDDQYKAYFDSSGRELSNTPRNFNNIVDSSIIFPGYIARPTDQRVAFSMFFQDYIPRFPFIKLQISLVFATGLPFGPPDANRYKDQFRIPSYKRVDLGFSGKLWDPKWAKTKNLFNQGIKSIWLSFEVFNILDISNTVSYLWIRDVNNQQYAVPNYLTGRRFNGKLLINF